MSIQFNNANELNDYLVKLERRIDSLEAQNNQLRAAAPAYIDGKLIESNVLRSLPQTNLLSPNFFKRAFTVWGHFFVAQFIIGLTLGICYACLAATLFGSVFGNILQNTNR
jgi:hypothetical protein